MSKCNKCRKSFDINSVITPCVCCCKLYHSTQSCTGTSDAEARVLVLDNCDPLLVYRCPNCKDSGGVSSQLYSTLSGIKDLGKRVTDSCEALNSFKQDFINLKKEVEVLKAKNKKLEIECSSLKKTFSSLPTLDEIDYEIEDRKSRCCNLILYNLPTPKQSDPLNNDLSLCKEVLKNINNIDLSTINPVRIGKNSKDGKPLPLLIKMKSKGDVLRVLKNKSKIPHNISVAKDKTLYQRTQLQSLIQTVNEHNNSHDNKLTIKYMKGTPTIVDVEINSE